MKKSLAVLAVLVAAFAFQTTAGASDASDLSIRVPILRPPVIRPPDIRPPVLLADADEDGIPDISDNCIDVPNTDQADEDGDGVGDLCELDDEAPVEGDENADSDEDGIIDADDNCIDDSNANQSDEDEDGVGDVCDADFIAPIPVSSLGLESEGDGGGGCSLISTSNGGAAGLLWLVLFALPVAMRKRFA